MKRTSIATLMVAAFIITTHVQCKKDQDKVEPAASKTDLLTSGNWIVTAHTAQPGIDYNVDGTTETDLYSVYEPCEKDDFFAFNKNGVLTVDEGTAKCDPDFLQSYTLKWAFKDNETKLNINGSTNTIEELTNTRLRISFTDDEGSVETLTLAK